MFYNSFVVHITHHRFPRLPYRPYTSLRRSHDTRRRRASPPFAIARGARGLPAPSPLLAPVTLGPWHERARGSFPPSPPPPPRPARGAHARPPRHARERWLAFPRSRPRLAFTPRRVTRRRLTPRRGRGRCASCCRRS